MYKVYKKKKVLLYFFFLIIEFIKKMHLKKCLSQIKRINVIDFLFAFKSKT